jgi:hypothetical protein
MDPRLRMVLLQLLQLAVEQEMAGDPLGQPAPDRQNNQYAPGTLGHDLAQLVMPQQHRIWPFSGTSFDFGTSC